jgi:hypothetical protein
VTRKRRKLSERPRFLKFLIIPILSDSKKSTKPKGDSYVLLWTMLMVNILSILKTLIGGDLSGMIKR